jgi:hypothetical protein
VNHLLSGVVNGRAWRLFDNRILFGKPATIFMSVVAPMAMLGLKSEYTIRARPQGSHGRTQN